MKGGKRLKHEKEEQEDGKITVERAAKLMGVSKEYVRIGLIQKRLPFRISSKEKYNLDLSYFT